MPAAKGRGRRSKQPPEPMKVLPKGKESPAKPLPMASAPALMLKVSQSLSISSFLEGYNLRFSFRDFGVWFSCCCFFWFCCSARHILCEKQGKITEAYKKLQDGWLSNGDKVPPPEFAKVACSFFFFLASSISWPFAYSV